MFDLTSSQKVNLYRMASYCTLFSCIFLVSGVILAILISLPDFQSSLSERINFIARHLILWKLQYVFFFLFFFLQIPVLYTLSRMTQRHYPNLVLWGLFLGLCGTVICFQKMFVLSSAIPRMAKIYVASNDELLKYSILANFNGEGFIQLHAISFSAISLGLGLLAGSNLLLGISLLKALKLSRLTGFLLIIAGGLGCLALIGYLTDSIILEMTIVGQIFLYFCCLLLITSIFYQEAKLNASISR